MSVPRSAALQYQPKIPSGRSPFIITYNPRNPPLRQWLSELHSNILHTSSRAREAIPQPPILGQRNPPNLRTLLMPSVLPSTSQKVPGCYRCSSKRCVICSEHLTESSTVTSDQSGITYKLNDILSCDSTNVIYLLYCDACKKAQYVGETQNSLKTRCYLHRSHIKKNKGTLVTKHFNKKKHSLQNMKCIAVERVYGKGREARVERERLWMHRLKTLDPLGLNEYE